MNAVDIRITFTYPILRGERVDVKKEVNILYVEDNPGFVFLVKEILLSEKFNFIITTKDNLESGIEAVENDNYDILILDLGLPDSQGSETFNSMRMHANGLPIIIFSSIDDKFIMDELIQKGAADYIVKGSDKMFEMNKKIENIFQKIS